MTNFEEKWREEIYEILPLMKSNLTLDSKMTKIKEIFQTALKELLDNFDKELQKTYKELWVDLSIREDLTNAIHSHFQTALKEALESIVPKKIWADDLESNGKYYCKVGCGEEMPEPPTPKDSLSERFEKVCGWDPSDTVVSFISKEIELARESERRKVLDNVAVSEASYNLITNLRDKE